MLSSVTQLDISCIAPRQTLSALLMEKRLNSLALLRVYHLDLTREHSFYPRALLTQSVSTLALMFPVECTLPRLIRFINSFRSLTSLVLYSHNGHLFKYNGQVLPPPRKQRSPSNQLAYLRIPLFPGINRFVEWYINEGMLFSGICKLYLAWLEYPDGSTVQPYFGGMRTLLHCCANTIRELVLYLADVPVLQEVSEICMYSFYIGSITIFISPNCQSHYRPYRSYDG